MGLIEVPHNAAIATGISIAIATTVVAISYWLQQKKRNRIPTEWKPIGKVEQLFVYPLKSGKAIELKTAECTELGLKEILSDEEKGRFTLRDRFFIIYNEKSQNFLTARQKTSLLLIAVKSNDKDTVTLNSPDAKEEITFRVPDQSNERTQCIVHSNEVVETIDCGNDVAVWLSKVILDEESGLRLGCCPISEGCLRKIKMGPYEKYAEVYKNFTDKELGAYSDLASYMLFSQESLNDLNEKLKPNGIANCRQFRPNIVVSGSGISPFSEDKWQWIKIGDTVIMRGFKPCTRCAMITLDPDTGKRDPNVQPLKTLRSYRKLTEPAAIKLEGDSPAFGRYFGLYQKGNISVGDTIYLPAS
ncbi:mitochondrial amidoxime-reducing component 1-like [Lycorma delicatula]|uniref:mitochondrial amidoxime-reducing component 1-like n=1 Tax=Lycorma delicatula TaxID=130591 RepID=UPI003F50E178